MRGVSAEVEQDGVSDTCNNFDLGWDDGRRIVELQVLGERLAMCNANDCNEPLHFPKTDTPEFIRTY